MDQHSVIMSKQQADRKSVIYTSFIYNPFRPLQGHRGLLEPVTTVNRLKYSLKRSLVHHRATHGQHAAHTSSPLNPRHVFLDYGRNLEKTQTGMKTWSQKGLSSSAHQESMVLWCSVNVQTSINPQISCLATLPRSGHPTKMTLNIQHRILTEVKKNPRGTAEDLKTLLELQTSLFMSLL